MKLGIMQPYFFPYAQQFRHIAQCDLWILFDTVKYSRKSWMNRNRIANRDTDWSYLSVPVVKGASNGPLTDAMLANTDWRGAVWDKLRVYQGVAPFFTETEEIVSACIDPHVETLAELNTHVMRTICDALAVNTPIRRLSEMSLELPKTADAGGWALIISNLVGASIYSNAPGGRHLFDKALYAENGVELEFYEPEPLIYPTPGFNFVADLSVLDSLMWMGPEQVKKFVLM